MKILIVAATIPEIAPLYAHFGLAEKAFMQTPEFDILITGVGMVATSFALGRKISPEYQLVLNLGIAGCFDPEIAPGTVLNIVQDEFSELGAEDSAGFISIEQLGFGQSKFSSHHHLLNDPLAALQKVSGITVNQVHGSERSIAEVKIRLNPVTESMEGAAVFYCSAQAGLPCLQVRSISNHVEPRNRDNWKIGLAIANLNEWAIRFLTNT
jgi:futalosine hydrolase